MAASLIYKKNELYVGKPLKMVRQELGGYDGFYFSDTIPAYLIFIASKQEEESWQIVFIPDRDRNIKDIIIHQNGR